jgi:3-deoxy-D-manno-oct-2-ulosonic acid (Kdo) hydroxylase
MGSLGPIESVERVGESTPGAALRAVATSVVVLGLEGMSPVVCAEDQRRAVAAVERGYILSLPHASFPLKPGEARFLSPLWSDGRAKNISFDGVALKGARGSETDLADLAAMVARFAVSATGLIATLFPRYAPHLHRARTSFRPLPAVGRDVSWRKDDSRLHIDAFPSRPNGGARILRVFTNLNPDAARVWRVGEPFEAAARRFVPRIRDPLPGASSFLATLGVTKGRRTLYDHLMLNLHDQIKADLAYQRDCPQEVVRFAPGTTWICYSDQVMHAAVEGQYMLEQTIHLPLEALYEPSSSPLAILERLTHRSLVPG